MSNELKMRIYVRDDLKMSRGKYAAQAVHAALLAVGAHPDVPVIVLGCDEEGIKLMRTVVRDAGRTEVESGTVTSGTNWKAERDDRAASVIAACVADIYATLETNDNRAIRYELGIAAESLIIQIAPAMGTTPEAVRAALDNLYI